MTPSPRIRRLAYGLALILLLVTTLPSLAGRLLLEQQLRTLGATTVEVRVFHLNLWNGRLTLRGLRADTPGRPWLRVGELIADIAYPALLQRRLHLTALTLHDTALPLAERDGAWQLGPLDLPLPPASAATNDAPPSAWHWGLSGLDLGAIELDLRYQGAHHRLLLDQLRVPALFQWTPEELSQMRASGALNGSRFALDGSSTPLSPLPKATMQIQISDLALGPLLALWQPDQQATLSIDASLQFGRQAANEIQLSTEGQVQIRNLSARQAGLAATAEAIEWQGKNALLLDAEGVRSAAIDGQLRASSLALTVASAASASPTLSLKTDLGLELAMQLSGSGDQLALNQTSTLALTGLRLQQPDTQLSAERLRWQGESSQQLDGGALTALQSDGALTLTQLRLQQPARTLALPGMTLQGELRTDTQTSLTFDGSLALQDSTLNEQHLKIASTRQTWNGQLALDLAAPALTRLAGDYRLQGLNLAVRDGDAGLSLKETALDGFDLDTDYRLSANAFTLEELKVAASKPLLSLGTLELQGVTAGPEHTLIDAARVGDLTAQVTLDAERQPADWNAWLAQLRGPGATSKTSSGEATTTTGEAAPYPFKLGQLSLSAPVTLSVLDRRIKAGRPMSLTLDRLDLAQLDTRSDAATRFDLAGRLNRFGDLTAQGEYSLFAEQPSGAWSFAIARLEMPPFSPYMNLHTGYQIASGQLQLDAKGTLKQGQLQSNQQLRLNRFEVVRGEDDAASQFDGRLGMPLELAVTILTDEDNNVQLDIPVAGSLSDPSFGIQSVINILLGKIAKEGAVGYLSFALQPYGALLSLGRMALDAMEGANIALEPVEFEPGSAQLTPTAKDYLGKLGGLLQQRPGLRLKLCGHAVAADNHYLAALAQQTASAAGRSAAQVLTAEQQQVWLYNLAESRGEEVKAQLQSAAVKGERLFSCLPQSKPSDEKPPRVQIGL